jgi:hypothetical protein
MRSNPCLLSRVGRCLSALEVTVNYRVDNEFVDAKASVVRYRQNGTDGSGCHLACRLSARNDDRDDTNKPAARVYKSNRICEFVFI